MTKAKNMPLFQPTIDAAFREYAELELRCHYLLLDGKENAPETVTAEDRMEQLWEKLDEVQHRSLSDMGSDLNWVRRKGEPPPKGRKLPEEVAETDQKELVAAIGAKDLSIVFSFAPGAGAAVPEPTSVGLVAVGCAVALLRRRRV